MRIKQISMSTKVRRLAVATSIAGTFVMALALGACSPASDPADKRVEAIAQEQFQKLTPILLADDVAACVDFWSALGLRASVTVPSGTGMSFAIVANDHIELMYQSVEAAGKDNPAVIEGVQRSMIFLEVRALDDILSNARNYEVVIPERTTSYGAREIYIRDPAGNIIGFSQPIAEAGD